MIAEWLFPRPPAFISSVQPPPGSQSSQAPLNPSPPGKIKSRLVPASLCSPDLDYLDLSFRFRSCVVAGSEH